MELQAWKLQLKDCLRTARLNSDQQKVILAQYELAVARSGDYEGAFTDVVETFGNEDGSKATQEAKASISQLEQKWKDGLTSKYGIDKIEYEQTRNAPDSLDIPPVTAPKHELDRKEYLRKKWNIGDGIEFSAWCSGGNGGYRRIETAVKEREAKSRLLEARGTYKQKPVTLLYTVEF